MIKQKVHPLFWLGLLAVLVWLLPLPEEGQQGKLKASEEPVRSSARLTPNAAKTLILRRDIFQPLLKAKGGLPEPPQSEPSQTEPSQTEPPALLAPFPEFDAPPPPSPLEGLVLRGVVESADGRLALLAGPDFPPVYLAEGQRQGKVKVEKVGPDWVEISAGKERKRLTLPGEFSVEPLRERTGGGQK